MNLGVRLSELADGDILATGILTYQDLNGTVYSGVAAAERKLQDVFFKLNEAGVIWVLDSLNPTFDQYGQLTFNGILSQTLYGNAWNFTARSLLYQQLATLYNMNVVVQVNFPAPFTLTNHSQYVDFVISAVNQLPWVKYWQIGQNPELIISNVAWADPIQYTSVLRDIYNGVKVAYPNITIMGPGLGKGLFDLATQTEQITTETQPGFSTTDYQHNWLNYAVDAGLLYYCDVFTVTAYQDNSGITILDFPDVFNNLNLLIEGKIGTRLPIWVIDQGTSSYNIGETQQAFADVTELLTSYTTGLPPNNPNTVVSTSSVPTILVFTKRFLDRTSLELQFNNKLTSQDLYYGLVGLQVADNVETLVDKNVWLQYKFLLKNLGQYNYSTTALPILTDLGLNVYLFSFTNQFNNQVASVVLSNFPFNYEVTSAVQLNILQLDGSNTTTMGQVTLTLSQNPMVIISATTTTLFEAFALRQAFIQEAMTNLISWLPSQYNKNLTDLNYYRFLRGAAIELGTVKATTQLLQQNFYLDDAYGDALYQNFGALINLPRDSSWTDSTYRFLIKSIVQALLTGPTLEAMTQAITAFTGYNAVIHELYNTSDPFVQTYLTGGNLGSINPRFAFVVEIIKNLDQYTNQNELTNEINYVIAVTKPAHTLSFLVVALNSSENYPSYYQTVNNTSFEESDVLEQFSQNTDEQDTNYGWRASSYIGQFTISSSLIGGPLLLGPRYTLYDRPTLESQSYLSEYHRLSSNAPTSFTLNESELNVAPFLYPDLVIQTVIPDVGYSGNYPLPSETHSGIIELLPIDEFATGALQPVFQFNLSQFNLTPLSMQAPAIEELITYAEFTPSDIHLIALDQRDDFTLNVTPLNVGSFTQGAIDNFYMPTLTYVQAMLPPQEQSLEVALGGLTETQAQVQELLDASLNLPEQDALTPRYFQQERFFMTNAVPLMQGELIGYRVEQLYNPTLELNEQFKVPSGSLTLLTGYNEPRFGYVAPFTTLQTLTNYVVWEHNQNRSPGLTAGSWLNDYASADIGYSEESIVKSNIGPYFTLNDSLLNEGELFPGNYDMTSFTANNMLSDVIHPITTEVNATTLWVEPSYMYLQGHAFMTNSSPLNTAVLYNQPRVTNYLTALGSELTESVAAYEAAHGSSDVTTTVDILGNGIIPEVYAPKYELETSRHNVIYAELKFGYLQSSNNLFMTCSSLTGSNAYLLYNMIMNDALAEMSITEYERSVIRQIASFELNEAELNLAAFNATECEAYEAILETVNSDGSTTITVLVDNLA